VWNATRVGARPERVVYNAHGTDRRAINSLEYNVDGTQIVSRSSQDDAVKVWDAKRMNKSSSPVATCPGLETVHEQSNAVFSPDGSLVCAGSSEYVKGPNGKRIESGSLKIYLVKGGTQTPGSLLLELPAPAGVGVVAVKWHPKLNQILATCSDGRYVANHLFPFV
jgi:WD40 repeat protein